MRAMQQANLFNSISRAKSTTTYSGFTESKTAAYGERKVSFGFVAVFAAENDVGIDENIPVGQEGKFNQYSLFLGPLAAICDGNICEASFLLKTPTQVIVATVDRTGAAFALHEIVPVLGLNFNTADIAANSIADNQSHFLLYVSEQNTVISSSRRQHNRPSA